MKKLAAKKSPSPNNFNGEFYKTFHEELTGFLHKFFQKWKWKKHYSIYVIIILKSHKKHLKETTDQYLLHIQKNSQQNTNKLNLATYKRIIYHDQVEFMRNARFVSANVIHDIKRRKGNISTDSEIVFDKIQHPLIRKTLNKIWIKETCLNLIKSIYEKPTDNIIFNSKRLKALLISETRHRWWLSPLLFDTVLEILVIVIMQKRKEKYSDEKEESKTISILKWHDLVYKKV